MDHRSDPVTRDSGKATMGKNTRPSTEGDKKTSQSLEKPIKGSDSQDFEGTKKAPRGWSGLNRALDYSMTSIETDQRMASKQNSADAGAAKRNISPLPEENDSIHSHEISSVHRVMSWSRPNIFVNETPARGSLTKEKSRRDSRTTSPEEQKPVSQAKRPTPTKTASLDHGEKKGEKETKEKKKRRPTKYPTSKLPVEPDEPVSESPAEVPEVVKKPTEREARERREQEEALGSAAKRGNVDVVRILLAEGANVNSPDDSGLTPLHRAARYGHVEVAAVLLDSGADINVRDPTGGTPLHWAAHRGHYSVVDLLINRGCIVDCTDNIHRTPLHDAAMRGHAEVVLRLMKAGADITMSDTEGRTSLDLAQNDTIRMMLAKTKVGRQGMANLTVALAYAATAGDNKEVCRLIEEGADVNGKDCYGLSPMHMASRYGHPDVLVTLLENEGDMESKDSLGATPLHWASYKGNLSCVRILLSRGAQVNTKDNMGRTPLHGASLMNHTRIVSTLIAAGANQGEKDGDGRTSLDLARSESVRMILRQGPKRSVAFSEIFIPPFDTLTPADVQKFRLSSAAEIGDMELLRELLNAGTYPDSLDSYGQTAMHRAASAGNAEAIELLLEHGASFENVDKNGVRPLHLAAQYNHDNCVRLLLSKGAKVDTRDCNGRTPLHNAARGGGKRVTLELLRAGASRDSKDCLGKTPYDLASSESLRQLLRVSATEVSQEEAEKDTQEYSKKEAAQQEEKKIPGVFHEGQTEALCAAASSGDSEAVERLLKNGAKPNEPGSFRMAPLHHAARFGQIYVAQLLLRNGADVDIRDADGATPLHWASCIGQASMVALLLRAHAEPSAKDAHRRTPLHDAAIQGHIEIVEELLASGALRQVKDKSGKTPYEVAKSETIRKILVATPSPRTSSTRSTPTPAQTPTLPTSPSAPSRYLAAQCPSISQHGSLQRGILTSGTNASRWPPASPAHSPKPPTTICPRFHPTALPSLPSHPEQIETRNSAPDVPDRNSENFRSPSGPLHGAPSSSPPSSSPPNSLPHSASSSRSSSPTRIPSSPERAPSTALPSSQREPLPKRPMCQILAAPGTACGLVNESSPRSNFPSPPASSTPPSASTPVTSPKSSTPPQSSTTSQAPSKPCTPAQSPFAAPFVTAAVEALCTSIKEGECTELIRRLTAPVSNLNELNVHGLNALHTAARYGRMEVMGMLLQLGADANARDADGATALHWASCLGHATCVALLLRRGADVDARDFLGTTALHDAARCGRAQALAALLAAGADTTVRDSAGRIPAQLASDGLTRETLLQVEERAGSHLELPCHPDSDDGRDDESPEINISNKDDNRVSRLENAEKDSSRCLLYASDNYLDNAAKLPMVEAARYTGLRYAARGSSVPDLEVERDGSQAEKLSLQKRTCEVTCPKPAKGEMSEERNQTDALVAGQSHTNASAKRPLLPIAAYHVSVTESSFITAMSSHGLGCTGDPTYSSSEDAQCSLESKLPRNIERSPKRRYSVDDTLYAMDSAVLSSQVSLVGCSKSQRAVSAPGRSQTPDFSFATSRPNLASMTGRVQTLTTQEVAKDVTNLTRTWSTTPKPSHTLTREWIRNGLSSPPEMESMSRLPRVWSSGHSSTDALCAAARNNDAQEVERVCAGGADVNAANRFSLTALHRAARFGNVAAAHALLQRGARTDCRDRAGATPLHWAACFGHTQLATLLLRWGAPVDARNALGRTPLHCAALFGRDAAARALLDAGADNTARDMAANTPMDVARTQSLMELLSQHGPAGI